MLYLKKTLYILFIWKKTETKRKIIRLKSSNIRIYLNIYFTYKLKKKRKQNKERSFRQHKKNKTTTKNKKKKHKCSKIECRLSSRVLYSSTKNTKKETKKYIYIFIEKTAY